MSNEEWNNADILKAVIHWTEYGFIEGIREVVPNFESALQHVKHCVERDSNRYDRNSFPTLQDVMAVQKKKLEVLQKVGNRGENKISGDYYYEVELYTDMLKDYEKSKS